MTALPEPRNLGGRRTGSGRKKGGRNVPRTEEKIYAEVLKQVGHALVFDDIDERTRVRLWTTILGWRGKIEGDPGRKKALAELLHLTRDTSGEPDPVPQDPQDQR